MEIRLGPDQLLRIWWARTWRAALASFAATAPVALAFVMLARHGVASGWLKYLQQAIILVIGLVIAYWISRSSLTRRYRGFRIAFLPAGADGPELPFTNRILLQFWWFLVLRVTLGAAVIGIARELLQDRLPDDTMLVSVVAGATILVWEFLVLRQALIRRYPDFRIAIIAEAPPQR